MNRLMSPAISSWTRFIPQMMVWDKFWRWNIATTVAEWNLKSWRKVLFARTSRKIENVEEKFFSWKFNFEDSRNWWKIKFDFLFYFIKFYFVLQKSCQQFFPIMRFVSKYLNFNIPEVSSEVTDRFHRQIAWSRCSKLQLKFNICERSLSLRI